MGAFKNEVHPTSFQMPRCSCSNSVIPVVSSLRGKGCSHQQAYSPRKSDALVFYTA